MIRFATEFDNQYYHVDPVAAESSPFGGLIASGAHVFALWNKLHLTVHSDVAWICGLGFEQMKFANALRPGREVYTKSTLLEMRESKSDEKRGIVIHRHQLLEVDETSVLDMVCTALVERRP